MIDTACNILHLIVFQGDEVGGSSFCLLFDPFFQVLYRLGEVLRRDLLAEFRGGFGIDLCLFLKVFRLFSVIEQLFCPLVCTQSIQEFQRAFF